MIGFTLFALFILLMLAGVPIGAALGLGGLVAIAWANADTQWLGLLAAPQNMQAGIAKYPLPALPMFVLVGAVFDRSGRRDERPIEVPARTLTRPHVRLVHSEPPRAPSLEASGMEPQESTAGVTP